MKTKVIIGISVCLISCALLINGYLNETGKQDVVIIDNTSTNTKTITTTIPITTTKKKTSKATVKTTKKTTKKVATSTVSDYHNYARTYGSLDDTQMNCLINLWNHESGWNPNSVNKNSKACGIPQALPCSKIKKVEGTNDWKAQIRWGIKYINYRYKNPCGAWKHFQKKHWY